jgi:mono/diheme cytochrome c family protein
MFKTVLCFSIAALCGASAQAAPQAPGAAQDFASYRAVLNRYCVTCHNQKLKTAGLMLDTMDLAQVSEHAPEWEKVVRKLRTAAMPPAGAPRPEPAVYERLASYLESELDRAAAANLNPGQPAIHRLNRAEYANAIRDLLALDSSAIDVPSQLPPDDSGYGFDNIGDVLSVSPALMERYMSVARRVSRLAVGDPGIRSQFATYDVSRFLRQDDRIGEELPFGTRGGIAVRHYFPLDGEYVIHIYLKTTYEGSKILGLAEPSHLDVRLDGVRVKQFTIGGEGPQTEYAKNSFAAKPDGSGAGPQSKVPGDLGLEVRIPIKAGTRLVGVAFVQEDRAPEDVLKPRLTSIEADSDEMPGVGKVTIAGPFNAKGPGETASRKIIFSCRPAAVKDQESCARTIIGSLARRAFRRPITDADLGSLMLPYHAVRQQRGFEAAIEMALERILVSPEFLFRIERDPAGIKPGAPYRLSDLELASRLSFFLWSSIPDEELLRLAERGRLQEPAVLEQQVRRMLADERSKALVENFAGQWLYIRNVASASPDLAENPEFDENLRVALGEETRLFLESMISEDHSVLDLLDANYTFLNERLAQHYGIPNVDGNHFRRVTLGREERRGLLGQGSIEMVTSYANRTSPTIRGKWVLENILGAPPPPPPPNVPSLKDRGEDGKILSMRQQMEQHRANPACAVCHTRMDPIGFALENFDAVGKWRTTSGAGNVPIDASGVLPDGTKFNGPNELRKILLSHPEQFVTTVTEKLLTYAMGRGVEYYDQPAVRKILRQAAPQNYRWSSLITAVAESAPFQMRRSREP